MLGMVMLPVTCKFVSWVRVWSRLSVKLVFSRASSIIGLCPACFIAHLARDVLPTLRGPMSMVQRFSWMYFTRSASSFSLEKRSFGSCFGGVSNRDVCIT